MLLLFIFWTLNGSIPFVRIGWKCYTRTNFLKIAASSDMVAAAEIFSLSLYAAVKIEINY
jgi:hypothetical protein